MELLILILVFAGLGYLLGTSKLDTSAQKATEKLALASQESIGGLRERWKTKFRRSSFARDFQTWVVSQGKDLFPGDFPEWLSLQTESDLQQFTKNLADYSHGLGYNLSQLIDGGLDDDPLLRQVFVEAITVYSSAYRRARKLRREQEQELENPVDEKEREPGDGKNPAARAGNPRWVGDLPESTEPASTD